LLAFSDDDKYDLNNDGKYEILSQNHVYLNKHSYCIYNVYNFNGEKLINVFKVYNYPLRAINFYRTDKEIAKDISYRVKLKAY